jgi:hypothetical protein
MHPRYSRLIAAVLLPVYLSACTWWTVQPVSPKRVQALTEQEQPKKIRVTLADSTRLELEDFSVIEDRIVGRTAGTRGADAQWQKVGIDQVTRLETASSSDKALYRLVGLAFVAGAAWVLATLWADAVTPKLGDRD